MLTNIETPPVEEKFCENSKPSHISHIMERYNWHMGFVDYFDMDNSYLMS
jgi:hypothetical protein